jgi:hypothetical protein
MPIKKLSVLALSCLAVILFAALPGIGFVAAVAKYANYWFAAAIFASFLYFLYRDFPRRGRDEWKRVLRFHAAGVAVAAGVALLFQIHEPHRAKILYDEDLLCGTAYQMHFEREADYPARLHYFNGRLEVVNTGVDKRPVMFPFVLSTVHDIAGYRPSNVFYLNGVLMFAFLAMLYFWTEPLAGRMGAAVVVLLAGTVPLFAQNATGAGFELLNMTLIVAFAMAVRAYLEKEGTDGLGLFIATALFLATTRYESPLFLFALAAVVLVKWIREKRVTLTWFAALSPLFLASALVSFRVTKSDSGFFQTRYSGSFFSLDYFPNNLSHDLFYLFSPPTFVSSNSLILSIVGIFAAIVLLVNFTGRLTRHEKWDSASIAAFATWGAVLVVTFITLIDNWGQWDDPMVSRYAMPFLATLLLSVGVAWRVLFKERKVTIHVMLAVSVWLVLVSIPQFARHQATDRLGAGTEARFFRDWANRNATIRDLFVDESGVGLMLEGHPAISTGLANKAPWKLQAMLDSGNYDHVYICERFMIDDKTDKWRTFSPEGTLDPSIHLRKIAEFHVSTQAVARISEVTGVDDPAAAQHRMPESPVERAKWIERSLP